ncbi:thiolase family protein, partial [Aquicoccus sp. SCR17]|nr:thiolase family protein [Carideicomes alvinocaridis]
EVGELVLSNALGAGGNPARLAALAAGLPERVAGLSLDRQCAGGLDALLLGQALIASDQCELVVAGGVESYSRRPYRAWQGPEGLEPYDRPPFSPFADSDPDMAEAAAALAEEQGISRARQDAWAQQSHAKALAARDALAEEIVAIPPGSETQDSFARPMSDRLCSRAKIITGSVTHANACVAADAAAFVVLAAGEGPGIALTHGVTRGGDPARPGLAPVAAIGETLAAAGLAPGDLSHAEIMEAYAVQALACIDGAGLDPGIVNRRGGALARGHPIGASGAVLAVRLWHDLQRDAGSHGLAAIAAAGGIGTALVMARCRES